MFNLSSVNFGCCGFNRSTEPFVQSLFGFVDSADEAKEWDKACEEQKKLLVPGQKVVHFSVPLPNTKKHVVFFSTDGLAETVPYKIKEKKLVRNLYGEYYVEKKLGVNEPLKTIFTPPTKNPLSEASTPIHSIQNFQDDKEHLNIRLDEAVKNKTNKNKPMGAVLMFAGKTLLPIIETRYDVFFTFVWNNARYKKEKNGPHELMFVLFNNKE